MKTTKQRIEGSGSTESQGEKSELEQRKLISVCAWCHPDATGPNITHTICEKHAREMKREAAKFRHEISRIPAAATENITAQRHNVRGER